MSRGVVLTANHLDPVSGSMTVFPPIRGRRRSDMNFAEPA